MRSCANCISSFTARVSNNTALQKREPVPTKFMIQTDPYTTLIIIILWLKNVTIH